MRDIVGQCSSLVDADELRAQIIQSSCLCVERALCFHQPVYHSNNSSHSLERKPSFIEPYKVFTQQAYNHQVIHRKHYVLCFAMIRVESAWKDQTCLLTGGTGMLGTALIVKLLLDTQIRRIYLIVRGGKGESPCHMISQKLERTLRP